MNQIKKVMKVKGIEDLRPTADILEKLGVKIHTWNKWVEGKKDPDFNQLETISEFLGCEVTAILPKRNESASL